MDFKNLLITGGAGFVGSNLAILFREARPDLGVTVLDSLKRRGSELNLPRLMAAGVEFRHGDIRSTDGLRRPPALRLDDRLLRRAVGPGRSGRLAAGRPGHKPGRHDQLPGGGPDPGRRISVLEHQPHLSDRGV